jgi:Mycobacterium membrane protein
MSDRPRRGGPDPQQPPYRNQGAGDPGYQYPPPSFGDPNQDPTQAAPRAQSGFHEAPTYHASGSPADVNPTQQLPSNWQQGGYDSSQATQYGPPPNQYGPPPNQYGQPDQYGQPWSPDGTPPEPPDGDGHGSRTWLWAIAGVALLLVIALVVAVLIVTSSSEETVVAPPIQPSATAATTTPRTTPRTTTSRTPAPAPSDETTTSQTSTSGAPGPTQEVVYTVTGEGTALNITYVDDGDVLQTEFRVTLPWTKTVQLEDPAKKASISVVKLGGQVSCSISVAGAEISKESGRSVTMCKGPS